MLWLSNDQKLLWGQTEKEIVVMLRNMSYTPDKSVKAYMTSVKDRVKFQFNREIRDDTVVNFIADLEELGLITKHLMH